MCQAADIAEAEDRGLSRGEISARETMWGNLLRHFGDDATLDAITKKSVIEYEGARRAKEIRGQTIRKEVSCLKRAFTRAAEEGIDVRPIVIWPKIRSDAPDERRRGKLVPLKLFDDWASRLPRSLQDEFTVCSLTGLRAGEIQRLERAWFRKTRDGWHLHVPAEASKTRTERDVPLPPAAKKILDGYTAPGPFFPRERWQGRYWMRKAAVGAGLERNGVTLRDLRATWGTHALEVTGDAQAVQAAMGHNDLKTTQRYQRSTLQRAQRAGRAVAKAMRRRTSRAK